MSLPKKIRYSFMKDYGAPALMKLAGMKKRKRRGKTSPLFGPPLKCNGRLKEIMTRHYLLSRYAEGAMPVAWVTSGAPVEILRPFGFYTIYPENHGALCGRRGWDRSSAARPRNAGITRISAPMRASIWGCASPERPRWEGFPDPIFSLPPTTSARPWSTGTRCWRTTGRYRSSSLTRLTTSRRSGKRTWPTWCASSRR